MTTEYPVSTTSSTHLVRHAQDDAALRHFWAFYEPLADAIQVEIRAAAQGIPDFAEIVRAQSAEENARQHALSMGLQRAAIVEGRWDGYMTLLSEQGIAYAKMGVGFRAWFDLIAAFRDLLQARLEVTPDRDAAFVTLVSQGMNRFTDIVLGAIGEAYIAAKQEIIGDQQEAIREISTPVLQIREQVLILPIVGVVDTHRARLITESVLKAIRARRARAVVMDVTGVPIVDSKVAKHLAQTCESARLMGALVIVTGISQEIAQTLVTIGADLSNVRTLGDLQSGIEEVERLMGLGLLGAAAEPNARALS
jgi:anti-anti-sigma factor